MTAQPVTTAALATKVPARHLRDALTACLLSAAKKDSGLPVLETVHVVRTGTELVFTSTDRYRMTRVTVDVDPGNADAPDFDIVIDRADAARILPLTPKTAKAYLTLTLTLVVEGDNLTIRDLELGATVTMRCLALEFPKVSAIAPTTTEAVDRIGLDPKFLADLAKMPGRDKNVSVWFDFHGGSNPVTSEWGDGPIRYLHLIMPVRPS